MDARSRNFHDGEHLESTLHSPFQPAANDTIRLRSRRWFLQTGLAGLAGLSLPQLMRLQAASRAERKKAVILFWLSGGPSQLDTWDPKPNAPKEIRGPFDTITTRIPGVRFSEHLPMQASIADRLSVIRSVDCSASNHTPITMQAGNPLARRTNDGKDGAGYPSMGSIVAKFRGPNDPDMPAFVGLAKSWVADVYGAGHMGTPYDPVKGLELAEQFKLPQGINASRLKERDGLRRHFDRVKKSLDAENNMARFDQYTQQAYDMVLSGKVERAFAIDKEADHIRDMYGRTSVGDKALMAGRLVESGVTFVLVSGAWGYFDHHGDNVRWGGIVRGLQPLLPRIDRALSALIQDLEQRGLLDDTFVMMMGEFGRSPRINNQAGRDHWTNNMSMVVAGGGMNHGQVIGSSDSRGGSIRSERVRPQDLAATTFRHLGIDLKSHWTNPTGRPIPIVCEGGRLIPKLV